MTRMLPALMVFALQPLVAQQQPVFTGGVNLVRIPLSITRSSEPVTEGLTLADFSVSEDGVAQSIAVFDRESQPLSLCIVLDVSGSMIESSRLAMEAIRDVTEELTDRDEVSLLAFADGTRVLVPWSAPAEAANLSIVAEMGGSTSLHDAATAALSYLEQARNPRSVVLLLTDGFDNSSRTHLTDVVKNRRQSEALVYAFEVQPDHAATRVERFGMQEPSAPPGAPTFTALQQSVSAVTELVGNSGGTTYALIRSGDPRRVAGRFVNELRYQYTIGYTPVKPFDGKYRRVKVELKKRGYQVRHRGGYLAMPVSK